jgi:hypothetical protein
VINNEGAEKRQHERYELKDRVFITIRPQFDRIGWLTDISKGGVSFEYLTVQDYSTLTENVYVDIFSSPREYDLSSLPCKLIYDTPVNKEKGFMESIETRRCGMAFGGMSQQQAIHLDLIMSQHT